MASDNQQKDLEELKQISQVGELKARVLFREGYRNIDDLEETSVEELSKIDEIGERNAEMILGKEGSKEGEIKSEIFCPDCGVVVYIDDSECLECSHSLELQGKVFHHDGEIEEPLKTLAEYDVRIMDGEEDPEIFYGKATILEKLGALEKALQLYDKVIELDPLFGHIWTAKASLSLRLGKLQDAAKAYKVAVNKHQINIPEMPEVKEEQKEVEERAFSVKEVENKVAEVRRAFFKLKSGNLPLEHLESVLKESVDARNNDDREKAVEKADELLELIDKIREISPTYEKAFEAVKEQKEEEVLSEMMEEVHSEIENEQFDEAEDLCHDILTKVEEIEEEKLSEEVEEESPEESVNEEKFLKTFDEAKEALNEARKTKINIDNIKDMIRETVDARKDEDYNKGIKTAKKALELSDEVNEIYSLIVEGKSKVKELRNKGGDVKPFLSKLREGKELADNGEYEISKELYRVTIKDIETVLEGGTLELVDEEDVTDSLEEVKEILKTAQKLGLDTGSASDMIEEMENSDNTDLDEVREEIFKELPEYMDKKVEGAKEELKTAKLSGADVDVSRCIHLLKKARKAQKRDEYENTIKYMEEYQDELES
ncbi:MAG: helix-hairpin-helix domain-containing protein [Thermoplasmatota archaeon]